MNLMNNLLTVNGLSKTYYSKNGETMAVDNISFEINKNDFIGIVGPSGCGKSSILNIISLLLESLAKLATPDFISIKQTG